MKHGAGCPCGPPIICCCLINVEQTTLEAQSGIIWHKKVVVQVTNYNNALCLIVHMQYTFADAKLLTISCMDRSSDRFLMGTVFNVKLKYNYTQNEN